jgi:hypothetical protein
MSHLTCEHDIKHSGEVHLGCDGCCAIFEGWIVAERQRMLGLIEDMDLMIAYRNTGIEVPEKILDAIAGAIQPEEADKAQAEFDSGDYFGD